MKKIIKNEDVPKYTEKEEALYRKGKTDTLQYVVDMIDRTPGIDIHKLSLAIKVAISISEDATTKEEAIDNLREMLNL